ncbi:tyrosine-protein phosphatase [Clostridium transplantifaecale]|uniref:tyrosine-protein phosphatase n=1 Tax=Clostridium transplantifaecale TaxID=2479838 RepID=UPI000F63FB79|nr:tyrosine-protein phosphatase [Clostridium transplantifaecale]
MDRPVKRFRLEHCLNMRDLGGYETADGRNTAFGKLLRAGALQNLTEGEWKRLMDYGVRTVLDLRSLPEIEQGPDNVPEGVEWYHCPIQTEQIDAKDISESAEKAFAGSLTEGYMNIVRNHGALLAETVRKLIAGLERGAVLFHCTAGKDRTGIVASCIYFLCGIADEDIIADYEVTYTYNKKGMNKLLGMLDEEARGRMEPFMKADAQSMERLLDFYREISLPEYLKRYGVTEDDIRLLQMNFLF